MVACIEDIRIPVLEKGERLEVLFADGFLCDFGVAQGHADIVVPQELHDTDEAHAGVEECRGVGVPQPMGDHLAVCFKPLAGNFERSCVVSDFLISAILK